MLYYERSKRIIRSKSWRKYQKMGKKSPKSVNMWKVQISHQAKISIESHVDTLWRYYDNLFSDTGMWAVEEIIKSQYRESATILRDGVYDTVFVMLERSTILGYSHNPDTKIYTVTTSIGTRRLFIEYREYPDEKIRVVTDVQIIRK